MTKISREYAWVPSTPKQDYENKSNNKMMTVYSIMDQVNKVPGDTNEADTSDAFSEGVSSVSPVTEELTTDTLCSVENIVTFNPDEESSEELLENMEVNQESLKNRLGHEAAHLFREICECGKKQLLPMKTKSKDSSLLCLLNVPHVNVYTC